MALIKVNQNGEGGEFFYKYVYRRVMKQNKHCLIAVVGPPGNGKSYLCLRASENLTRILHNKPYDINHTTFNPSDTMKIINSGNLKRGSCLTIEEIGISASARQWHSVINQMLVYLFQSFRNMGLIVFINTPNLTFIDSNIRKLINVLIQPKKIDFENKMCKATVKVIDTNPESGKVYKKHMKAKTSKGIRKIKKHSFKAPPEELSKVYEDKKWAYTRALNIKIMEKIEKAEKLDGKKMLTGQQEDIMEAISNGAKSQKEISEKLQIDASMVSRQITSMRKKGYNIPKTLERRGFVAK